MLPAFSASAISADDMYANVDVGEPVDLAAIAARVTGFAHDETGAAEHVGRLLHQPALRGNSERQLAHCAPPRTASKRRSV